MGFSISEPFHHPLFRPFTDADWQAFAGVESERPLIAELPWGVVIVDGYRVQAVLADDEMTSFARTFALATVAEAVALRVALLVNPTHDEIAWHLDRI